MKGVCFLNCLGLFPWPPREFCGNLSLEVLKDPNGYLKLALSQLVTAARSGLNAAYS